eukprot:m.174044 g.174044  ORF g.174044 m.174044 type:complete len:71 (+) comp18316_c0_seq2:1962-2174(+)
MMSMHPLANASDPSIRWSNILDISSLAFLDALLGVILGTTAFPFCAFLLDGMVGKDLLRLEILEVKHNNS